MSITVILAPVSTIATPVLSRTRMGDHHSGSFDVLGLEPVVGNLVSHPTLAPNGTMTGASDPTWRKRHSLLFRSMAVAASDASR